MRTLLALLLVGCGSVVLPPAPPRKVYPPADCAGMCATYERLHCKWYAPSCVDDCASANAALATLNSPPLDTACGAASDTCDEAFACRGR